ncbi:MAG: DUF177 domain-containing protein [Bacteroidales bacterium]|jgi:uncharacterized metal-binding protein YceD (DUF177 family)|nr:DUF177 domain-containing protein [Bacteroidales bacterium]
MKGKKETEKFEICFGSMAQGVHHWQIKIDNTFFENNVNEDITGADIDVQVSITKEETMIVLVFDFEGELFCDCDRCLEKMSLKVSKSEKLILKLVAIPENSVLDSDDDDIIFLSDKVTSYNVEQVIFEYLCLDIPMRKVHEDETLCNAQTLEILKKYSSQQPHTEVVDERWEGLKNIKLNN